MSARIYTAAEARALREAAAPAPWEAAFGRSYGETPRYEYFVRMVDRDFAIVADVCGEDALPSKPTADLIAAAHDLAASVEHHAARADALAADLQRVTMELHAAKHLAEEGQRARVKQSLDLAEALARIAELEASLSDYHGVCSFCGCGGAWCCAKRNSRAADVLRANGAPVEHGR